MRRASLAPDSLVSYGQHSSSSVVSRFRCDETTPPSSLDAMLAVAAAAAAGVAAGGHHHQLHHAHHTTTFKPTAVSSTSSSGNSSSTYHRRRSLPIRAGSGGHARGTAIVGGQMPAHRRRPVIAPETKLNAAQHPHVQPTFDHKIQTDDRTLRNLKETERDVILTFPTFLESAQSELLPHHRTTVVQWMKEVLSEDGSDEEVFPLSVLILDNYLTIENILLRDVQGIASACMLMASKIKAPAPMNAARLSFFTESSVSSIQIVNFELLILRTLKWQIALPTAFDFADQIFCRVPALRALRTHFVRALYDMQLNVKDAVCRPSIQAAVSLARAARALSAPSVLMTQLRAALSDHLDIDLDVALHMGTAAAAVAVVASDPVTPHTDESDEDEAFDASSLAYTPVYEDQQQLLQPAAVDVGAVVVAAPAPRSKSPPVTPPSGTDSGFSSTQGTPESATESDRPPSTPF